MMNMEIETDPKKEQPKYFYIRKNNNQIVIILPRLKTHPIKTLVRLLNDNVKVIDFNLIPEDEKVPFFSFLTKLKELVKL